MPPKAEIDAATFSKDVLEFIRLLEKHGVLYVIAGGGAVIFHGYPRYTGDVVFFYERTESNTSRLFAALLDFWNGKVPEIENAAELMEEGQIVQFGRPPNRIDLLSSIDGLDFSEAWDSREKAQIIGAGHQIAAYYLGKAALIKNKKASGRPRDLDDVQRLERPN
jgi:hypothetical protein